MMRIAILLTLLLAAAAAAQTTRTDDPGELERALAILRRLDTITVSVNYVETPLAEVIEDLNWFVDIPLSADWEALLATGVDDETEVSLRLEDVPLATVLAAVALQLRTDFDRPRVEVFKAGMLVLTSEEGSEQMRLTDVYDVRDLLADKRVVEELRHTAPSRGLPPARAAEPPDSTTQPGWRLPAREDEPDAAPVRDDAPRRVITPGEELMNLVCEHVDPEAWIEFGGTRATISERDGVLIVTAASTVHRDFQDALRRLRRAFTTLVAFDAAIVDVPRPEYERLTRRHELSSAALGRSIFGAEEAHILWRSSGSARLENALVFDSKGAGVSVLVELETSLDRATGLLTLDIRCESIQEGDERRIRTSVTIPSRQGGATIELPSAAIGDSVRLLVLIPERG